MMLMLVAACGCEATARDVWQNVVLPGRADDRPSRGVDLPPAPIPANVPPRRVRSTAQDAEWGVSLDEAIRIALERARVIRILAGRRRRRAGRRIYDAAITQTSIDQALARFDAVLSQANSGSRTDTRRRPRFDRPYASRIVSTPFDSYQSTLALRKRMCSAAASTLH